MLAAFSGSVMASAGRTVAVQPLTQIVLVDRRLGDLRVQRSGRARRVRPGVQAGADLVAGAGRGLGLHNVVGGRGDAQSAWPPGDRPCDGEACCERGWLGFARCARWDRAGDVAVDSCVGVLVPFVAVAPAAQPVSTHAAAAATAATEASKWAPGLGRVGAGRRGTWAVHCGRRRGRHRPARPGPRDQRVGWLPSTPWPTPPRCSPRVR